MKRAFAFFKQYWFWICILLMLLTFILLGVFKASKEESVNWNATIAVATILAIAIQTYFNHKSSRSSSEALQTSTAQHKENLKYQEKIALFEKRSELLEKLSRSEFVNEINNLLITNHFITFRKISYYGVGLHFASMVDFVKQYELTNPKEVPIINWYVINKMLDTSQLMVNQLGLLFNIKISGKFREKIHEKFQEVYTCLINIAKMNEVVKNAERINSIFEFYNIEKNCFTSFIGELILDIAKETKIDGR